MNNKWLWISLSLYCFVIGMSHGSDLTEGLEAGKAAYETMQIQNFEGKITINSPEIQSLLNQNTDPEVPLDLSAVPNKTAASLIRDSANNGGKAVNQSLLDQDTALKNQAFAAQQSGIKAAGLSLTEAELKVLTPNEIVNQNMLNIETFPNVRNPATEPAFKIAETLDPEEAGAFNGSDLNISLQEQYSDIPQDQKVIELYEMGCSTTLLKDVLDCEKILAIETELQPDAPLSKTITVSFWAQTYDRSIVTLNFKTGDWSVDQRHEGAQRQFSDLLGEAFGSATTVTLNAQNNYKEDGGCVHQNITQNPSAQNEFAAKFSSYQDNTKHKNNRNKKRGATLRYTFSTLAPQPPRLISEQWQSTCEELEDLVRLGHCKMIAESCLEGPQTRVFGKKEPFLSLSRDCWKKRLRYRCEVPQGENDCDKIPRDCLKSGSEFIDFLGQHAVEVHHFRCQREIIQKQDKRLSLGVKQVPLGDYQKNNDIGEAIAGLNIAKEMTEGFRAESRGIQGLFFGGNAMECTSKPKQCCADSKSFWRTLTGCRDTERQLAVCISKGLCHEVGSYRVKNSLLQKIGHVDKKGYCCFSSKLSRIIQEGARAQLPHANWGTADAPNCRALTIAEIQSLNWSAIDFSEIARDVIEKAKNTPLSTAVQTMFQNQLSSTLSNAAANLKKDYPHTPLGRNQNSQNKILEQQLKDADTQRRISAARQGEQKQ